MDTPIAILHSICLQNNTTPDYTLLSKEGQVHLPVFTYQVWFIYRESKNELEFFPKSFWVRFRVKQNQKIY